MFFKILKYINILLIFFLAIVVFLGLFIHFNFFSLKDQIYNEYPNLNIRKYLFKKDPIFNQINNDYNVKFLPETEFLKLKLNKKKINFKKEYYKDNQEVNSIAYTKKWGSFYIEIFNEELIATDYRGNIYNLGSMSSVVDLNDRDLNISNLYSNLPNKIRVFDTFIYQNNIYVAFKKKNTNCKKIYVSYANLNAKDLNFKNLFSSDSCNEYASPGRMQLFQKQSNNYLLLSISSGTYNQPSTESQNINSIFGKTILINLSSKKVSIFSIGHRVIQGLFAENDLIISTEHGPRGGDENNYLKAKQNYGWPISSYGEKYDFDYEKKPFFKKNHKDHGFIEPVYSFIPAIGISELIKLPNDFSEFLSNTFIVSSLYGRSIFLVKFNNTFDRVIFVEKIFVNERIRDIKYDKDKKVILLAFEENGEIGIISKVD